MKARLQVKVCCTIAELREEISWCCRVDPNIKVEVGDPISCDKWFTVEVETEEVHSGGLYSLGETALSPFVITSIDLDRAYKGLKGLRPICKEHKELAIERRWIKG